MRLFIQIPCLNERDNLPATFADFPREVDGVDPIDVLIIDDFRTAERWAQMVAKVAFVVCDARWFSFARRNLKLTYLHTLNNFEKRLEEVLQDNAWLRQANAMRASEATS